MRHKISHGGINRRTITHCLLFLKCASWAAAFSSNSHTLNSWAWHAASDITTYVACMDVCLWNSVHNICTCCRYVRQNVIAITSSPSERMFLACLNISDTTHYLVGGVASTCTTCSYVVVGLARSMACTHNKLPIEASSGL